MHKKKQSDLVPSMSTKRKSKNATNKEAPKKTDLYSRTSVQLFRPSIKLNNESWTNYYTKQFQQFWNKLYVRILENETHSKMPQLSNNIPININNKNKKKRNSRKRNSRKRNSKKSAVQSHHQQVSSRWSITAVPKKGDFPYLLYEICKSLQFGIMNIKHQIDEKKGKESDILSFYFTITFETNYKHKYFLYLKYMFDDVLTKKTKKIEHGLMEMDTEIRTKKCQITCDYSYGDINRIINNMSSKKFQVNVALPANILIEIFGYLRPTKYLPLYSSVIKESDDNFDAVENSKFDKKNFNLSNIEWICNFFGMETWHFMKMFKILMKFLDENEVMAYIKKEKDYNKKWDEWREAQQDLNTM